jgi:hypothetical protein
MFKDLGVRIKTLTRQREEIILMIDANHSLSDPRSKFSGWTNENKLVDILVQQHGTEDEPATYAAIHSTNEMLAGDVVPCTAPPIWLDRSAQRELAVVASIALYDSPERQGYTEILVNTDVKP